MICWYLPELLIVATVTAGSTGVRLTNVVFNHKSGFNVQVTDKY